MNVEKTRLLKIGAITAAAGALAISLGLAAVSNRSTATRVEAAGPLPAVVAFANPAGQLQEYSTDSSKAITIGAKDHFTIVRINPAATKIAAYAGATSSDDTTRLHLWNRATGTETIIPLGSTMPVGALAWSPAGDLIALVGATVQVYDGSGRLVAASAPHSDVSGTVTSLSSGGYSWSEDGATFVTIVNGFLITLDRNGIISELPLRDSPLATSATSAYVVGWSGAGGARPVIGSGDDLLVFDRTTGALIPIDDGQLSARVLDGAETERQAGTSLLSRADNVFAWARLSAGRGAVVAGLSGTNGLVIGVVLVADKAQTVRIGGLPFDARRGGDLVDAVATR